MLDNLITLGSSMVLGAAILYFIEWWL